MKLIKNIKVKWDYFCLEVYIKCIFYLDSIKKKTEKYTYKLEDKLNSRENNRRE